MNLYCWVSRLFPRLAVSHPLSQQEQTNYYHPKDNAYTYRRPSLGYFPDDRMGPGIVRAWRDARYTYPRFPNAVVNAI